MQDIARIEKAQSSASKPTSREELTVDPSQPSEPALSFSPSSSWRRQAPFASRGAWPERQRSSHTEAKVSPHSLSPSTPPPPQCVLRCHTLLSAPAHTRLRSSSSLLVLPPRAAPVPTASTHTHLRPHTRPQREGDPRTFLHSYLQHPPSLVGRLPALVQDGPELSPSAPPRCLDRSRNSRSQRGRWPGRGAEPKPVSSLSSTTHDAPHHTAVPRDDTARQAGSASRADGVGPPGGADAAQPRADPGQGHPAVRRRQGREDGGPARQGTRGDESMCGA